MMWKMLPKVENRPPGTDKKGHNQKKEQRFVISLDTVYFQLAQDPTFNEFLTASKYCGSGLKIDLVVVVVVVILVDVLVNCY